LEEKKEKKDGKKGEESRFKDSITVRVSDKLRVKADGMVIFPH